MLLPLLTFIGSMFQTFLTSHPRRLLESARHGFYHGMMEDVLNDESENMSDLFSSLLIFTIIKTILSTFFFTVSNFYKNLVNWALTEIESSVSRNDNSG